MTTEAGALKEWAREKARGLRGDWNILYGEECVVPAEAIEAAILEGVRKGLESVREEISDDVEQEERLSDGAKGQAVFQCAAALDAYATALSRIDALLKELKP